MTLDSQPAMSILDNSAQLERVADAVRFIEHQFRRSKKDSFNLIDELPLAAQQYLLLQNSLILYAKHHWDTIAGLIG